MERMSTIHRVASGAKPARALASAGAVLALGLSLLLGACGHRNQNTDNGNGASAPTTSQTGNTGNSGSTGYQGSISNVQDLQALDASVNDDFTNLDLDAASMNQDLSGLDQEVQP